MARVDVNRWGKDGVVRPKGYRSAGNNYLRTTVLLAGLLALLVFIGGRIGGTQGMILFGLLGAAINLGAWWFSDKIALALNRAQPMTAEQLPEVYEIVQELAGRAGLPAPRLYLIPSKSPNAFATGRNPAHSAVAVTEGILRMLKRAELRAVLAHEMAHILNRDTLVSAVAATVAGLVASAGRALQWGFLLATGRSSDDSEGSSLGDLALAIVAPIVAMLLQLAISRSREYGADAAGARLSGDPNALADALVALEHGVAVRPYAFAGTSTAHLFIVNPFTGRSLLSLLSTHPPVEKRVERLRAMSVAAMP